MKRLLLAALAAAAIGVASPALAQDTKDSKDAAAGWKLAKGDKARYVYSYEFERAIEAMGMQLPQTTKLTLHLAQEVTDVAAGTATVSAKIERVMVDADLGPMGGGAMNFDSADAKDTKKAKNDTPTLKGDDDDDDKPAKKKKAKKDEDDDDDDDANPFAALQFAVGKTFSFKVAADGTVSDVDGLDEISMKVAQKGKVGEGLQMPRQGDMAGAQRMMKKMALPGVLVLLQKDVVQQTLDLQCHLFVAGSSGDSWKIDTTEQIPGMGNISFTRTIAPKGEGEAGGEKGLKLEQTSSEPKFKAMAVPPGMGGGGGMGGMMAMLGKLKMKSGSYKATSVFSKEKGRLLSGEVVEKATLEGSMPNPMAPRKGKGKKAADDDDDDEDAPAKKKSDKKDDSAKKDDKKDDSKKDDDDDDDDGGNMKLVQKVTLRLKYAVLTGDATKSDDKKSDEKKDEKKKDKDF